MSETLAPATDLSVFVEQLAALHPRLCPRQVLGVRMGLYAAGLLRIEVPRRDKRLLALVEMDGCFADGISVATGCWLGRRTLHLLDYGKVAVTLAHVGSGRAVRVWPRTGSRERALDFATEASDRWHGQLLGYQRMPAELLLCAEHVDSPLPLERVLSHPGLRVSCARCGEEVFDGHEVHAEGQVVCEPCSLSAGGEFPRVSR